MAVFGYKKAGNFLPYMMLRDSGEAKQFAQWLKDKFTPLLKRRLPEVYYSGFSHSFVPDFINKHKHSYPYIIRLDITKFYPSIPHQHLLVESQIAYRELVNLSYVPKSFKKEFLPQAYAFLNSLPVDDLGLPLTSSVSKAWAPLVYVTILLEMKRRFNIRFIVFVDDFWIMAPDVTVMEKAYTYIVNELRSRQLTVHPYKVSSGRLGSKPFYFLGYKLAGGYISIEQKRIDSFKERIMEVVRQSQSKTIGHLIKLINRKITGFGHYYKYAKAKRIFAQLDRYVIKTINEHYIKGRMIIPRGAYKEYLNCQGLRSLEKIIAPYESPKIQKKTSNTRTIKPSMEVKTHYIDYTPYLEKLIEQQKQVIGLLKGIQKEVSIT